MLPLGRSDFIHVPWYSWPYGDGLGLNWSMPIQESRQGGALRTNRLIQISTRVWIQFRDTLMLNYQWSWLNEIISLKNCGFNMFKSNKIEQWSKRKRPGLGAWPKTESNLQVISKSRVFPDTGVGKSTCYSKPIETLHYHCVTLYWHEYWNHQLSQEAP